MLYKHVLRDTPYFVCKGTTIFLHEQIKLLFFSKIMKDLCI